MGLSEQDWYVKDFLEKKTIVHVLWCFILLNIVPTISKNNYATKISYTNVVSEREYNSEEWTSDFLFSSW